MNTTRSINKMISRLAVALSFFVALPVAAQDAEPSVDLARLWWPEQTNVWTPFGWPDHYFKFNVLYNGGLILSPATQAWRPHSQRFAGNDLQVMFCASEDGHSWPLPQAVQAILREWDGGLGVQYWDPSHDAPVLHTEYRSRDGVVMGTAMFAHVEGGAAVRTALEPFYARIRVRVKHVDAISHPDRYKMSLLLSKLFMYHVDFGKLAPDIAVSPGMAPGIGTLALQPCPGGYSLVRPDGMVRMAVYPGNGEGVALSEEQPGLYNLCLDFPAEEGAFVDIVLPMLCQETETMRRETTLSYDAALAEADRYWASRRTDSAATFDVPETFVTEAVRRNIDLTSVIAEKDYETGEYCYITGTWGYDALWSTPGAFVSVMLDYLGYPAEVDKYADVFLHTQGTATPPGPSYQQHPGYLATPRHLQSIDWLSDHGAILWSVASHALLTGDEAFIAKWTDAIVRACEFIVTYARGEHPGVAGLLPPGWSSDEATPQQSTWILAWNYRGMSDAVRLLKKTGHPRAEEFSAFLAGFKETFLREYRKTVEAGPRWTDAAGRERYLPSTTMSNEHGVHTFMTDAFYLDVGPLCLVWAGLMEADDPIMRDLLAFFREGPNWQLRKPFPWSCDRPVLEHEISTCEPCYSMNAFHSWQLGDRQHFLEAMYSIIVGAISQNTFISCEHRHGMQGTLFAFSVGFTLARLAVIDEQVDPGNLHLLRFCPLAWLQKDRPARFLKMPTEFGPVDLTAQLSADGKTLEVQFQGDWRERPGTIVLHVPPVPGLKKVLVNGKKYAARGEILVKA